MISVRGVLAGLAVAFTAYLAVRGLWWTEPVPYPLVLITALVLYLLTTWLCIFWEPGVRAPRSGDPSPSSADGVHGPTVLPLQACVLALATAVLIPTSVALGVGDDARTAPYATWYLGGIGALMAIVMARRRVWVAWSGIAILTVAAIVWMGAPAAMSLGLVGSIMWVAVAQLLVRSMDRAARDTSRLAQLQRASSAWQTSQAVRQRERRLQIQRALVIAGPILTRTVVTGAELDPDERLEARVAEGALRDEMRGRGLLDDDVRAELAAARGRGATVTVLDEGGLEDVEEATLDHIRAQLAATLREARSDRLYIRTSPHDRVAVTVVGRSAAGPGLSDEDAVELWREIPRVEAAAAEGSA